MREQYSAGMKKEKEKRDPVAFKAKPLLKNPTPPRNLMEEQKTPAI